MNEVQLVGRILALRDTHSLLRPTLTSYCNSEYKACRRGPFVQAREMSRTERHIYLCIYRPGGRYNFGAKAGKTGVFEIGVEVNAQMNHKRATVTAPNHPSAWCAL